MVTIKKFIFNPFQENSYFLWDEEGSCIAVDPGIYDDAEADAVKDMLEEEHLALKAILLTHGHFDHIFGVKALQEEHKVPVFMGPDDLELLKHNDRASSVYGLHPADDSFEVTPLHDGDILDFLKDSPFLAIATPGHSMGGFSFYDEADKVLLSGDTLFAGAIGRTDLFGGEYDKLIVSVMDSLMGLPGDVDVLPGHGGITTISDERTHNPFLQPFNEPQEEQVPDDETFGLSISAD